MGSYFFCEEMDEQVFEETFFIFFQSWCRDISRLEL